MSKYVSGKIGAYFFDCLACALCIVIANANFTGNWCRDSLNTDDLSSVMLNEGTRIR